MFSNQDFKDELLLANKYKDWCDYHVLDEEGNIISRHSSPCFGDLMTYSSYWEWELERNFLDLNVRYIDVRLPTGRKHYTHCHRVWESFILNYPAWKNNVTPKHSRDSAVFEGWVVDTKGLASNSLLTLLSALRYMWVYPDSLYVYKLLLDNTSISQRAAFNLAACCTWPDYSTIELISRNHRIGCYPLTPQVEYFLKGTGSPEGTEFYRDGSYLDVGTFISHRDSIRNCTLDKDALNFYIEDTQELETT